MADIIKSLSEHAAKILKEIDKMNSDDRKEIREEILEDILELVGPNLNKDLIREIIFAVTRGEIRHLTINY